MHFPRCCKVLLKYDYIRSLCICKDFFHPDLQQDFKQGVFEILFMWWGSSKNTPTLSLKHLKKIFYLEFFYPNIQLTLDLYICSMKKIDISNFLYISIIILAFIVGIL